MAKNNPAPQNTLPPDLVEGFLQLQRQELHVRQEQLKLETQQVNNNKEIALKSIEANAEAGNDIRQQYFRNCEGNRWLFFSSLLAVVGLCAYALYLDKTDLVETIVKVAIGAVGGLGLGYHLGTKKRDGAPMSYD